MMLRDSGLLFGSLCMYILGSPSEDL